MNGPLMPAGKPRRMEATPFVDDPMGPAAVPDLATWTRSAHAGGAGRATGRTVLAAPRDISRLAAHRPAA